MDDHVELARKRSGLHLIPRITLKVISIDFIFQLKKLIPKVTCGQEMENSGVEHLAYIRKTLSFSSDGYELM